MKIILYSRPQITHNAEELTQLFAAIDRFGFDYSVNEEFAEVVSKIINYDICKSKRYSDIHDFNPNDCIMISYGGDGTFLECVRKLEGNPIPMLGINSGRLGFLANVPKHEVEHALQHISEGNYTLSPRSLLHVDGNLPESISFPYAFNEFAIQRNGASMVQVECFINGEMIASYWGDGVLLSTPSGSTAYSLSVGGPIVAPSCECFIISPIAPHNLTMRPIIVPDNSEVEFQISSRDVAATITIDTISFETSVGSRFKLSRSNHPIFLVQLQNISFYETLKNKMMWGIDPRATI